ncbi:host attachment protein [Roseibium salinum]|nr:host attachment protein [Roseibium salinum]
MTHGARQWNITPTPFASKRPGSPKCWPNNLKKHRAAADFDRLVIIAEPRMLGLLRDALPAPLKSVVNAEIAKDLSNLPAAELYTAIAGLDTARPRL